MVNEAICRVCGGTRSEHFDAEGKPKTQHVFTEQEGQLMSHAEAAKMNRPAQPAAFMVPGKFNGTDASAIQRLLELMLERGALTQEDALYIVGVGPKPEKKSGYIDPALLFGTGTS